jgi:dipeptidyl aminopeptidase/acylaminoacyl peptidase
MRRILLCLSLALSASAAEWSLEKLYTRPFVWGTAPERLTWAETKPVLVFLWNEQGRRFLDLYAWHAPTKRRVRLTDLELAKDEFNPLPDENDERLKANRMPEAGLSEFSLSPDGARVAYVWRGDLYLAHTDGSQRERLTQTKTSESAPAFSPDGARLLFRRGGELFVQTLATGFLVQLTEGPTGTAKWSPDGTRVVYTKSTPGSTRSQVLMNYSGQFARAQSFSRGVAGDDGGASSRFVVPSAGGKPVQLQDPFPGQRASFATPVWSPDSRSLLVTATSADHHTKQVWVLDAKTGKGQSVFEDHDDRWVISEFEGWSPDSRSLLIASDRDGFIHLWKVPAAGGTPVQLTKGRWELDTESFSYPPQWIGEQIVYCSTEAGTNQRQLYRIAPDGSGKRALTTRSGLNVGAMSKDGQFLAVRHANLNAPWDLFVNDERVTTSPRPEFASYHWPQTEFVEFPSRADRAIVKAKLLLPPGYSPQKQYPCVFFIHGAGIASSVLQQWGSYLELRYVFNAYLANSGYVVMDLDYRGSSGYGRDWRTGVYLHMGGPDLQDVLGAVDYLKARGGVDMNRLGIWGVSYGGFMTNMALFLSPGTFKAGSSWAAVNDWENYNPGYTQQRLATPAAQPEAYRRSSPITFSGNLRDHLQIVHGMVDSNVLFQDAVQLTEKLIRERKPFEEIFYPQEDHGFVRDETLIDAFTRTARFFREHLRP